MKSGLILAGLAILGPLNPLWFPYGALIPGPSGNPDWNAYAGQPGSTYDAAANPPQTVGMVSYDPYAPLPPVTPATPSGSASNATAPR